MTSNHIDVLKLFDTSRGRLTLTPSEQLHIRQCEECRTLRIIFSRQQNNLQFQPGRTGSPFLKRIA